MPAQPEPTTPYPPRYWWLKRLCLAGVGLVIVLGLVHWWWASDANRKLAAVIAEARARGEPILPEDFPERVVADEDNAAAYLRRAAAALKIPPADETIVDAASFRLLTQKELETAGAVIDANALTLAEVRAARMKPIAAWNAGHGQAALNAMVSDLSPMRRLTVFMVSAVTIAHQRGDDAAAIEYVRDGLGLARAAYQQDLVVGFLIALGTDAMATGALERMTDLSVATGPATASASHRPAQRSAVAALIAELLDEEPCRQALVKSYMGERAFLIDAASQMPRSALGPMVDLDLARALDGISKAMAAARSPNRASAVALLPPQPPEHKDWRDETTFISRSSTARQVVRVQFQHIASRRMAAVALACRLYTLDHGSLPQSLAELVPEYLHELPADPFDAASRPLRYRAVPQPFIYSVGVNGVDDGGAHRARSWSGLDVAWLLGSAQPPTTAASQQAVNEDGYVPHEPGEADQ